MFMAARARSRATERSYRAYVTDSLRGIPKGEYNVRRWSDLTRPHAEIDVQATIDMVASRIEALNQGGEA